MSGGSHPGNRSSDKQLVPFWVGRFFSSLGTTLTGIAIPFLCTVFLQYDASEVALIVAVPFVITIFSPLYAGVLADKFERRRSIALAEYVKATALVLLAISIFSGHVNPVIIVMASVVVTVAGTIQQVSFLSVFPDILGETKLEKGNGTLQAIDTTTDSLGAIFGGVLLSFIGPYLAFLLDGVFSLISALTIRRTSYSEQGLRESGDFKNANIDGYFQRIAVGFREIWLSSRLRLLIIGSAATNFFIHVSIVPFLFLFVKDLGFAYWQYTLVLGVGSLGAFVGSVYCEKITSFFKSSAQAQAFAVSSYGVLLSCYSLLGESSWLLLILACAVDFAIGVCISVYVINNAVEQQKLVPSQIRGSVNAARGFFSSLASAGGAATASALLVALSSWKVVIIAAVGVLLVSTAYHRFNEVFSPGKCV